MTAQRKIRRDNVPTEAYFREAQCTEMPEGVASSASANKPPPDSYLLWYCRFCNDGPHAEWHRYCQQCGRTPGNSARVERHFYKRPDDIPS